MNSGGSAPADMGGEPPVPQMGEPGGSQKKFASRPPKRRWLRSFTPTEGLNTTTPHLRCELS